MKKLFLSLITIACLHTYAQDVLVNDANAEKRTLSGSFTAIKVSDGIDVMLTQGNEESIAVSASDQKFMGRFKTEVVDGTLKIYYDNKSMIWNNNEKRKLKAYVSFKTLQRLDGSSGASVNVKSILKSGDLKMTFSSGASFSGQVDIDRMDVSQSSGAEINISGKANKLTVDLSSGAIFKGFELTVDYCDAKASSGAGVRISVNKELNAKASSGGGVRYKGEAVIKEIDVSSGGIVKRA